MTHKASLVHITPNAEELVAYMARVSNPSNQNNTSTSARLIRYLITNQHWSPFEMVNMCVEIHTSRSIAAQILRHRSFSFQEFSQRYGRVEELPSVPSLRRQDAKNRQNSIDDLDPVLVNTLEYDCIKHYAESYRLYQRMLDVGVAKECAREVLPLATPTKLYMNGSIRSWLHYCDLRTSNGTQKEHAKIAGDIQDILWKNVPGICEAMWDKNNE
ncbi:MAG: FAD-dependent thymidylate synthase [Holophagaceae bacterium]